MGAAANERRNEVDETAGSCWDCGYALRGLTPDIGRCPDCGRAFDPADPRSSNRRRKPLGFLAKRALLPPGWPTARVAAIAAAMVLWGTGSVIGFHIQFDDWPMLRSSLSSRAAWTTYSAHWGVYAAGVAVSLALLACALLRVALRLLLVAWYRPPLDLRRGRHGSAAALALLLGVSFICVICGAPLRIGREWANDSIGSPRRYTLPPVALSDAQRRDVVRALALAGDTPQHRRAAMAFATSGFRASRLDSALWREAASRERDPELRADELRFLSFYRDQSTLDFLSPFLGDPRPPIRAAAADAIGIIAAPAYRVGIDDDRRRAYSWNLPGTPPIPLYSFSERDWTYRDGKSTKRIYPFFDDWHPLPPERRQRLARMMLEAPTLAEREAAARAILPQPPDDYRFRYAEWGVWLSDNGDLTAARAATADVPPFVHRTGNSLVEMLPRVEPLFILNKPVIHLSVSEPIAVDLEVMMRHGRPWFVYPMPDDFEIRAEEQRLPGARPQPRLRATQPATNPAQPTPAPQPFTYLLAGLDPPAGFGALRPTALRSGYPWSDPAHRSSGHSYGEAGHFNELTEWGLHWQSLIVTPTKPSWTHEPDVGPDPRHAWWHRLRSVECSWISSRGEGERFLYYDGPTLMRMPFLLLLKGERIDSQETPSHGEGSVLPLDLPKPDQRRTFRQRGQPPDRGWFALAIRVADGGRVESAEICPWADSTPFDRHDHPVADGAPAAEWAFWSALRIWGLTESESAGLLDTWRAAFFEKPGSRVLTIMPYAAYHAFCPLSVFPQPTESTRVGIVVTELGGKAK